MRLLGLTRNKIRLPTRLRTLAPASPLSSNPLTLQAPPMAPYVPLYGSVPDMRLGFSIKETLLSTPPADLPIHKTTQKYQILKNPFEQQPGECVGGRPLKGVPAPDFQSGGAGFQTRGNARYINILGFSPGACTAQSESTRVSPIWPGVFASWPEGPFDSTPP